MIPYDSFIFFLILALLLIPTVILGLLGKSAIKYNLMISVIILFLIFGINVKESTIDWKSMISVILFTLFQVVLITNYHAYRLKKNGNFVFILAILLAIFPLVLVGVLPFFHLHIFGFLGIAYITLKIVQLVMEIRDGMMKKETIKVSEVVYFILYFPTVSAGPIDRWKRFDKDFNGIITTGEYKELLKAAVHSILIGILYKFIIAVILYNEFLVYLPDKNNDVLNTWEGNLGYMYVNCLYSFFDFAGYGHFAIGVSYMMGIRTPRNFNLPFISRNIKEFWDRWHMTLSYWFRDYVYMRFVIWVMKKGWIKNSFIASYLGYFLLFCLMGIWHGLEPHYLVYGLYHAILIVSFDKFDRWNKKKKIWKDNKWMKVIGIVITFHFVSFGFYIFSGEFF